MKKLILVLVIVVIVLALALPVGNLVIKPSNDGILADLRPDEAPFALAAALFEDQCVGCHVSDADLPFYAGFPVLGGKMDEDILGALRSLDMKAAFENAEEPVSEVVIAKIERAIEQETMPPGHYRGLHWDVGFSADDEHTILGWIRKVRGEHYVTGGAAPEFATEVVQPLPAPGAWSEKAALGNRLYHDTRLSGDDTISCATCHALDKGGTDQLRFSKGILDQEGGINAPTVYNAVFMVRQFWDGRAVDLADQAGGPVTNPIEMGAEWPKVLAKLSQDEEYATAFAELFGDGLTQKNVQNAIAIFESTLVTTGSDFDAWLMGTEEAISAEAKDGYALFKEHGCSGCHAGKALGGQSFEYMGLHGAYFTDRGDVTEADYGLYNFTKKEADRHKLKVPTLRNVTVTWPYFHDGSTSDLSEAVRTMARYQVGVELPDADVANVVVFLESLTGNYDGKRLE